MNLWFEWHCLTDRANKTFHLLWEGGEMLTGRKPLLLKDQMWTLFAWELKMIADNILFPLIKKKTILTISVGKGPRKWHKIQHTGMCRQVQQSMNTFARHVYFASLLCYPSFHYLFQYSCSVMHSLNLARQKIYSRTIW